MAPNNTHLGRKLGAVERLGRSSGPAPAAALKPTNLNTSRASLKFYEKASSRQSREKRALQLHPELSRDNAVALKKPAKRQRRTVLTSESYDGQFEERGRERARNIALANIQQQKNLLQQAKKSQLEQQEQEKKVQRKRAPIAATKTTSTIASTATKTSRRVSQREEEEPKQKKKTRERKEPSRQPTTTARTNPTAHTTSTAAKISRRVSQYEEEEEEQQQPKKKTKRKKVEKEQREKAPGKTTTTAAHTTTPKADSVDETKWKSLEADYREFLVGRGLATTAAEFYALKPDILMNYCELFDKQKARLEASPSRRPPPRAAATIRMAKKEEDEVIDLTDD